MIRLIRRRVLVSWLCALVLLIVIALCAATCGGYNSPPSSPSTPGGPTPTNSSY